MTGTHWSILWALLFMLIVFIEGLALGTGHSEFTLSYTARMVRFDPIGRFVFLAVFWFLAAHFVFAPKWLGVRPDWRSAIGVGVGIVQAIVETLGWFK